MSGIISDTYAVVDKTKKIKNRTERTSQQEVTAVYAIVDKKKKTNKKTDNMYDDITSSNVYNTVDDNATNDVAPNPLYSGLDRNEASESSPLQSKEHLKPFDFNPSEDKKKQSKLSPLYVYVGFIAVVSCLVAAVIAFVVAFVLVANLQSDITALSMKISNSSESSNTMNSLTHLAMTVTELRTRVEQFLSQSEERFDDLLEDINSKINSLQRETNYLINAPSQILNEVNTNISDIQRNLNNSLSDTVKLVMNWTETTSTYITNSVRAAQNKVVQFASSLAHDIQRLHVFDSCTVIRTFSLPFLSGNYIIRSSNGSTTQIFCNNSIPLTCDGATGEWRRIAYIHTSDTTMPVCPAGLEARATPPSCRQNNFTAGCSSVIFPVRGNYSCVYGSVIAHQSGDPDGFTNPEAGNRGVSSIEGNYVDGLSLTYGNSPAIHIWTFAASIPFFNREFNCNRCRYLAPPFIDNHYTCDTFPRCGNGTTVCSNPLWTGSNCSSGDATFYRQLPVPTSEDIEMRVCRDQDRNDEDLLLMLVEIYVV